MHLALVVDNPAREVPWDIVHEVGIFTVSELLRIAFQILEYIVRIRTIDHDRVHQRENLTLFRNFRLDRLVGFGIAVELLGREGYDLQPFLLVPVVELHYFLIVL